MPESAPNPEVRVLPISPDEIVERRLETIPPQVIETFNRFIGERALNGYATVYQDEVVTSLEEQGMNRGEIFSRHWLDVEPLYREAGWKVEYDKPGYNETYRPYFKFKKPRS